MKLLRGRYREAVEGYGSMYDGKSNEEGGCLLRQEQMG